MMSNGIDGINGGGGRFIPPGGGGPPPPGGPGGPGGPNGPGDDGDHSGKKVEKPKQGDYVPQTPSQMLRRLYEVHNDPLRYGNPAFPQSLPELPTIDTLNWFGRQEGISDDDRTMLAELREKVVLEEARRVDRQEQGIDDVHKDLRAEVAAMLAQILAFRAEQPPSPPEASSGDEAVNEVGGAGGGGMNPNSGQSGGNPNQKGHGNDGKEEEPEGDPPAEAVS